MNKKQIFYLFLIVHAVLWTLISLLRNNISYDSMEAVVWGELISFGTNKHPPLSGWIASAFYNLCGQLDFILYIVGQLFIVTGFVYVYKIAKFFLDEEKAFCASMILEACSYYTWMVFVDTFNCNILLMALCPMMIYYFYKAVKENRIKDWLLFGITAGLSFLGKYQCVFIYFAMAMYLLVCQREQFKRKGMYISIAAGLAVILPHVIWLFQNDFFSFAYMLERTHSETHNLPVILVKLSHLFYPVKFVLSQLLSLIGCFVVYAILALKSGGMKIGNKTGDRDDKLFLLIVGIVPVVIHGIMGLITGSRVPGIWGSIMVSLTGIMLFYFFPVKFNKDSFSFFTKLVYASMAVFLVICAIYINLQTKFILAFPHKQIIPDMERIWSENTNNAPLKYTSGYINFWFRIYDSNHPTAILDTFGHENPWISQEDIAKNGVLVFDRSAESVVMQSAQLLPGYKITPQEYQYKLCNKMGKCKSKSFYYGIIFE